MTSRRHIAALFFVVVLLTGVALSFLQMHHIQKQHLQTRLQQVRTSLDITLSHAELAAQSATLFLGHACTGDVLTKLRTIVATVPDVRSVNLAREDEVYCTSVFGGRSDKIERQDYVDGKLLLLEGNVMSPRRSLLVWRSAEKNGRYALIGIDGYYIYDILQVSRGHAPLYFRVGNQVMTLQGHVIALPASRHFVTLSSERFPYALLADDSYLTHWRTFLAHEWRILLMVVGVSLLLTFFFMRYLRYRETLEFQLAWAVQKGQIRPWIQPIIDARTGCIAGGEILLRWLHPKSGFIPPDSFIAVAEQNGTIKALTRECFRQVIQALNGYRHGGGAPLMLCFNVSAAHFRDEEIVSLCKQVMAKLEPEEWTLVLEVTEREHIENSGQVAKTTSSLKEAGVLLSLDDFGTGNANYSYLQQFAPEFIKIDKTFTRDVTRDPVSLYVVESIIQLAERGGCAVIAEGIEFEEQRAHLLQLGVTHFQGYLFSRPIPLEEFLTEGALS